MVLIKLRTLQHPSSGGRGQVCSNLRFGVTISTMPGQPKTRALMQKIKDYGIDRVFDEIADTKTLADISRAIGVERPMLSKFINKSEFSERLREARRLSAALHAEDTIEIADGANRLTERVAKLKIDNKRWLASKYDRDMFGEQPANVLNVNLNSLHLDALRSINAPPQLPHGLKGQLDQQRSALRARDYVEVSGQAGDSTESTAYEHNRSVNSSTAALENASVESKGDAG